MPHARIAPTSFTTDTDSFSSAIESYVKGRVTVDNPTLNDYKQHYGNNRAIAERLVDAGYYANVKSAMRQVQRMNRNPTLRVTPRIKEALGSLALPDKNVTISIKGYASYDNGATGWRPMNISHTFTPSQMRSMIADTHVGGNDAGYNAFNREYGIPVNFQWLSDVNVTITPA